METNYEFQSGDPRRALTRAGRAWPYTEDPEPYTTPGDLLQYASWAIPNPLMAVYRVGAVGKMAVEGMKKRSRLRAAMDPVENSLASIFGGP